MKHKHHIIPKHAGGTDDPSNIVELTVEEHAEAHRKLYEKYGRWQDLSAWKGLTRQNPRMDEVTLLRNRQNFEKAREALKKKREENPEYFRELHKQTGKKVRATYLAKKENGYVQPNTFTREAGLKAAKKNNSEAVCPHCGKKGQYRAMKRWHFEKCKKK